MLKSQDGELLQPPEGFSTFGLHKLASLMDTDKSRSELFGWLMNYFVGLDKLLRYQIISTSVKSLDIEELLSIPVYSEYSIVAIRQRSQQAESSKKSSQQNCILIQTDSLFLLRDR